LFLRGDFNVPSNTNGYKKITMTTTGDVHTAVNERETERETHRDRKRER